MLVRILPLYLTSAFTLIATDRPGASVLVVAVSVSTVFTHDIHTPRLLLDQASAEGGTLVVASDLTIASRAVEAGMIVTEADTTALGEAQTDTTTTAAEATTAMTTTVVIATTV